MGFRQLHFDDEMCIVLSPFVLHLGTEYIDDFLKLKFITDIKLGSVAGPVIQANGRLSFEDGLRSGGLLYCVSQ